MTIAPFPNAAVCRVGDQLVVTCSTNSNALDWEFVFAETNDCIDSTVTSTQQIQEIVPSHSTVFIFSRTSKLGTIPLVSTLDISSVGQTLNGSNITCTDSTSNAMATIMVHIIGENDSRLLPLCACMVLLLHKVASLSLFMYRLCIISPQPTRS